MRATASRGIDTSSGASRGRLAPGRASCTAIPRKKTRAWNEARRGSGGSSDDDAPRLRPRVRRRVGRVGREDLRRLGVQVRAPRRKEPMGRAPVHPPPAPRWTCRARRRRRRGCRGVPRGCRGTGTPRGRRRWSEPSLTSAGTSDGFGIERAGRTRSLEPNAATQPSTLLSDTRLRAEIDAGAQDVVDALVNAGGGATSGGGDLSWRHSWRDAILRGRVPGPAAPRVRPEPADAASAEADVPEAGGERDGEDERGRGRADEREANVRRVRSATLRQQTQRSREDLRINARLD